MEIGIGLTQYIPFIVYLGFVSVLLLTLLYRIEIGIFFVVPLLPLQNLLDSIVEFPGGKDFLDLLCLAMLIRWFYDRNVGDRRTIVRKKLGYTSRIMPVRETSIDGSLDRRILEILIIIIVLWTHLSLWRGSSFLGTGNPITAGNPRFITWKNFVMLPLLYFIVVNNIKEKKHIQYLLILMALSMLFMDRNFYSNFSSKDHSSYNDSLRIAGTFTYLGPNELAVFYAQHTAVILALLMIDDNFRRKMLFLATTAFNYFCLMFLFSRGGYLASVVSWMFFGFIKDRRIILVLFLFVLGWRLVVPVSVQQRIDMTEQEGEIDRSIEQRYIMWDFAIGKIKEFPIFGTGYNTTPHMNIYVDHARKSLHNGYIEVTMEQGFVGIIIFLVFFGLGIVYAWRLYTMTDDKFLKGLGLGFAGCVLAVLAGNIAGSYWFYINVSGFYWVNLALVMRAIDMVKEEKNATIDKSEQNAFPQQSSRQKFVHRSRPEVTRG
ncbi:MAG: O-antigen ligase family protein [Calditrichaeota bacterium]|nr:O-antigen ligase family protein [Calditrichota bacterium]MCB0268465.1 O-antigen ligase family protein [Calditrichota bacterium]MCB0285107.1 O-antigen ligase family protein [Calditrichota bacterium]MCB0298565.1 O-antigen ligase family protein [Calditrichota bacterium]MCB9066212.1 O-antigen ligase family protein [Calditrichia bacterium]